MLPGCGGGNSSSNSTIDNTVATLDVSPASLSLDFGQVVALGATPKNKAGGTLVKTVTYKSDNSAVASVSTSGNVCAGTWDTNFIVCTPATTAGTANITATAESISTVVKVSTHRRIASLTVTSTGVPCTSQTLTQQFTAKAFASDGTDITSTVGTVSWLSTDTTVATIDTTGLATAVKPGKTNISALVNNVISVPVAMITCPPASITIKEAASSPPVTAFTMDVATTKTLESSVIDTLGNPITTITLNYSTSQSAVAIVSTGGVISAVAPGTASVVASCTPPNCNSGLTTPVYSNLVTVSVNGTSSTTAYATGKTSTTIVPIDTTTNTAGTAINIPTVTVNSVAVNPVVNSFVFSPDGITAYIGTDQGMLTLLTNTGTVGNNANMPGTVLAVSPDNTRVLVAGATTVFSYNIAKNSIDTLAITGATAASFSPDSLRAYIAAGTNLYDYSPPLGGARVITTSSAINDVAVLRQGNYLYLAGDVGSTIAVRADCNGAPLVSLPTAQKPTILETTYDGTHVYGTEGTNMYDVSVTASTAPCPPPAPVQSMATTSYGVTMTPNQLIVSPDGSKTYLTNSSNKVLVYAPVGGMSQITLAGGATASTTGGVTLDGKSLYIGATGTNDVQKIDTTTGVVTQIPVSLKDKNSATVAPDFVVVRPK